MLRGRFCFQNQDFGVSVGAIGMVFRDLSVQTGPRVHGWGGGDKYFRGGRWGGGGKKGGPENMNLWKNWFPIRFSGDLCEGIGLKGA